MEKYVKLSMIFNPEQEVTEEESDQLTDGMIDLLYKIFPNHSGSCISLYFVDEDGNPIRDDNATH